MRNCEYLQKGFSILHPCLARRIGKEFKRVYKRNWAMAVREALSDQERTLCQYNDKEILGKLDILCCLRLVDRRWHQVFSSVLPRDCRSWAIELMGTRNQVAHAGSGDLDREMAVRALETMAVLCVEIDKREGAKLEKLCKRFEKPRGLLGFFRR